MWKLGRRFNYPAGTRLTQVRLSLLEGAGIPTQMFGHADFQARTPTELFGERSCASTLAVDCSSGHPPRVTAIAMLSNEASRHRLRKCSSRQRSRVAFVFTLLVTFSSCDRSHQQSVQRRAAHSGESRTVQAPPPPIRLKRQGPLETPYTQRTDWRRAAGADPMDLLSLANRIDARTLLEIALGGGRAGAIALAALGHSESGYFLLRPLCDQLTRFDPVGPGLSTIEVILDRFHAVPGEVAELSSAGPSCKDALTRLKKEPSVDGERATDLLRQFDLF